MLSRTRTLSLVCLISINLLAAAVSALPSITIDVQGGVGPEDVTSDGTFTFPNPPGEVYFWSLNESQAIAEGGGVINSWTVSAKEDPYVTNNINLSNNTGLTQIYTATVLLPGLGGTGSGQIISSSVGATITDSNGNNSMLLDENGGIDFYQGQINGVTELGLAPTPLSTANCSPFPNVPGCTATDSDGIVFQLSGTPNANDIAIILHFSLTPGDSVGITSRFEVVPEPFTGALFGLGLVGLAFVGRRRR